MSGYSTREVVTAIAAHLHAHDAALYIPEDSDETYPDAPALPVVVFGSLPARPHRAVSIRVYDWSTARDKHNPDVAVQLRFRGSDPLAVADDADRVYRLLDQSSPDTARVRVLPGGVRVALCVRRVVTDAAPDGEGRFERPDSYVFTLNAKATP